MGAIFKREFRAYFQSPLGYIFLAIMYLFSGLFFTNMLSASSSYIQYVFAMMFSLIMIIIPFLTMRLMSEDKKLKTDQLLLTSPTSVSGVVWGKYLAALTVFFMGVAMMIIYMLILATFTTPNWNIFLGNFIGVILFGAAIISIGLFVSSLTESQMIAAIISYAIIMLISFFDTLATSMPQNLSFLATIFQKLSFNARYQDLVSGVLNISHLIFFISITVVFNFLTVRVIEKKRWS